MHSRSRRRLSPLPDPDPTTAPQAALDALRRIVHALRRGAHAAAGGAGLSGAQRFVLRELAREPASSLASLAERTHTDASSVSAVAARLVAEGLVERTPSRTDRRRAELGLTARGRRVAQKGDEPVQERLVGAIATLAHPEVKKLAGTLGRLITAAGIGDAAPMFFEDAKRSRR